MEWNPTVGDRPQLQKYGIYRPQSPDTRQQQWPGNDSWRQMDHLPLHGSGHHGRRYQSLRAQASAAVSDRWTVPRGRGGIYS